MRLPYAQTSMVTDVYSHILDDDRRHNAELFEEAFYSGKGSASIPSHQSDKAAPLSVKNQEVPGVDPEKMAKLLADPTVAALLATLANKIE